VKKAKIPFNRLDKGQYDSADPGSIPVGAWESVRNMIPYNGRLNVRGGTVTFTKDELTPHPVDIDSCQPAPNIYLGSGVDYTNEWALVAGAKSSGFYLANKLGSWVRKITNQVGGALTYDEMPWKMDVLSSLVYAVRRNGGGMKSIDANDWYLAGRPKPAAAMTAAENASGTSSLGTGTYNLSYSYFDSRLGYWGPESDETTVVTTGANDIVITAFGTSLPVAYRTDRFRVWMTLLNGTRKFLVGDYTASALPITISEEPTGEEYLPRHSEPPADIVWWTPWIQRSWWVRKSELAYSLINFYESYSPIQALTFDPEDGEDIVVAYPWGNVMVVAKSRKMWKLAGYDRQSWETSDWTDKAGCVAPHSMKDAEGALIWKGEDGFYKASAEGAPQNISTDTVRKYLEREDTARRDLAVAEVIPELGLYVCLIRLDDPQQPWGGVAYNWRSNEWVTLEFPRSPVFIIRSADSAGKSTLFAAGTDGQQIVNINESRTDEGASITAWAVSGAPKLNDEGQLTGLKTVWLLTSGTRWPVTVSVYGDNEDTPMKEVEARLEDDVGWKGVNISTMRDLKSQLQVGIKFVGKEQFWVSQMAWDVLVKAAHRRPR
jgi:hypothetical protein